MSCRGPAEADGQAAAGRGSCSARRNSSSSPGSQAQSRGRCRTWWCAECATGPGCGSGGCAGSQSRCGRGCHRRERRRRGRGCARSRQTSQAAFAVNLPEGRCASGPFFNSAATVTTAATGSPSVTTDLESSAEDVVARYASRWGIEQAFADARQIMGVGEARNRTRRAVERMNLWVTRTESASLEQGCSMPKNTYHPQLRKDFLHQHTARQSHWSMDPGLVCRRSRSTRESSRPGLTLGVLGAPS